MTEQTRTGWRPCPPGAFLRLTADLAARRARHLWLTVLGVAVGTVLTGVVCWQAAAAFDDWQHGRWNSPAAGHCQPATPASSCQPAPASAPDEPKK
jgi:hypothetical protein